MRRKPEDYTEKELVEGCVSNDRWLQEALYRRFFPAMLRMCRRYTDQDEEAMEIINTGFLRVFQKIHLYHFSGSLEGWIRRLIFHSIADYYRQRDRKLHFLDLEDRDAPVPEGVLSRLYCEDLLQLVERLPGATQEVFWLFAVEGLTHQEIAARLGISEGTSKWHLSNARQKLKALMVQSDYPNQYAK
jgi:RNA polymerase sigma-70 factor (ECF subfamily)